MSATQRYDLYSPEFRATTHETYARMREESPVHVQPGLDGETPIWFVTRYDDVVAVLTDDKRFVLDAALALTEDELREREAASPLANDPRVNTNLLSMDGDDHRRVRRLVTKAFTPRMVEQLRPRIQAIADELLDRVREQGAMDIVDDYAFPLPITVIAELLGIPVEDQDRFRTWSNSFVLPPVTEELQEQFVRHTNEFVAYLDELFAQRRSNPTDDLVSALVQAEEEGDHLSENELYSMVVLLIVAGHETTVSLITNAVHTLLTHPEELAALRTDPSLIPAAVEELLRHESPVERAITRWAAEDVELGGETIRRGELVIAVIGSANRDPARFPDPGALRARPRRRQAPRLRTRQPLLPGCTARAPRDRDRPHDAARTTPEPASYDRRGRPLVEADTALPQPRVPTCRLGRLATATERRAAPRSQS